MARYRIGNDMTVVWSIYDHTGAAYYLKGKEVRLYYTCERGRFEADFEIQGTNKVVWSFWGREQKVIGDYTLSLEIIESAGKRRIFKDYCNAFTLVGKSCEEAALGNPNISEDGNIVLSSKLDVYKIQPIIPTVGSNSNWFVDGADTGKPSTGKSAYEYAKEKGYEGTESEYAESLKLAPENSEKLAKLSGEIGSIDMHSQVLEDKVKPIDNIEEDGFFLIDSQGNILAKVVDGEFDALDLGSELRKKIQQMASSDICEIEEDGFYIVDAKGNIAHKLTNIFDTINLGTNVKNELSNSISNANILTYSTQYEAIEKMRKDSKRMLNNLASIKDETAPSITKTITIPMASANEDVSHAVIRIGFHRGEKIGTDTRCDVFFDGQCRKDFSDVRIKDSEGNILPISFLHCGNYEVVRDNRLGNSVIAMDKVGNLYHISSDGYIYKTSDDFKTMEKLPNQSFRFAIDTLFIDSKGGMWVNGSAKLYVCYPINGVYDFANAIETLDFSMSNGEVNQTTNLKATGEGVIEDSAGYIYMGQYQENYNPVIFRSIYPLGSNGIVANESEQYFKEVYTQNIVKNEDGTINLDMTDQHIHHIHSFVTKDSQGRNVDNIIAGIDSGNVRGANLISSINHGETWVSFRDGGILKDSNDWVQQRGRDYSLTDISEDRTYAFCHGEADILGGMTMWKMYTEVDEEGRIIPSALAYPINTGQGARGDNMSDEKFIINAFLPSTNSSDTFNLVVSEDRGKSWKCIYNEYRRTTSAGAGDGARWIKRFDSLPNGADEMCWYATGQNTNADNYAPLRIYKGGEHYYGEILVYLGDLKKGKDVNITIESGYSYMQPSSDVLIKDIIMPVWELPLNECVGDKVQDSNGIWHDIVGKYEWDGIESTKRFYQYYPMLKDNSMVGGVKLDIGTYISLGKIPQLNFNKGFSALIWIATGDYSGTLRPNQEYPDVYFPIINSQDFNIGFYYWFGAYAGGKKGGTFASANIQNALNKASTRLYKPFLYTFSNDAIPVVKCYTSDRDVHTLKNASSWNIPMLNKIELKIGSDAIKHEASKDLNKNYFIGSIAFYDKELTENEVRSILNGKGVTSEYNLLFHE